MYAEARGRILAAGCGTLASRWRGTVCTAPEDMRFCADCRRGVESSELWKGDPVRTGSRTARLRRRGKRLSSRYPSSPHHAISLAETRSSLALTHSWGCCVCRRSKKGVSFAPSDSTIADLEMEKWYLDLHCTSEEGYRRHSCSQGPNLGKSWWLKGVEGPAGRVSAVQPTVLEGEGVCSVLCSPPLRPMSTPS